MTPELEDADAEQRDWTEFFEQFQADEDLEPHHNVEIKELLAQPEYQESGELIFYYHDLGSFWLYYDKESYEEGTIAEGTIELRSAYFDLSPYDDMIEIFEEMKIKRHSELDNFISDSSVKDKDYILPFDPETMRESKTTFAKVKFPVEYSDHKRQNTIKIAKLTMEDLKEEVCNQ